METKSRFSTLFVSMLALAAVLACRLLSPSTPEAPAPTPVIEIEMPSPPPEPTSSEENGIFLPPAEPFQVTATKEAVHLIPGATIDFAVQGPVTGAFQEYYDHIYNATAMATREYNLTLGDFGIGRSKIDDRCEEVAGATAAEQLLTDHPTVLGVIGPFCSAPAMEALPVYQEANLVSISGGATREDLSILFGSGGFFNRTVYHDGQLRDLGIPGDWVDSIPAVQDFYARYENQYGPIPEEIRPLMAYTYDATQVLLHAIEQVAIRYTDGSITIERAALAQAVRRTEGFTGLTGLILFDENGDRVP